MVQTDGARINSAADEANRWGRPMVTEAPTEGVVTEQSTNAAAGGSVFDIADVDKDGVLSKTEYSSVTTHSADATTGASSDADGPDVAATTGAPTDATSVEAKTVTVHHQNAAVAKWSRTHSDATTSSPSDSPAAETTKALTVATTDAPWLSDFEGGSNPQTVTGAATDAPIEAPTTEAPTDAPTDAPTEAPTTAPTDAPTETQTEAQTGSPIEAPIEAPTEPQVFGFQGDFIDATSDTAAAASAAAAASPSAAASDAVTGAAANTPTSDFDRMDTDMDGELSKAKYNNELPESGQPSTTNVPADEDRSANGLEVFGFQGDSIDIAIEAPT